MTPPSPLILAQDDHTITKKGEVKINLGFGFSFAADWGVKSFHPTPSLVFYFTNVKRRWLLSTNQGANPNGLFGNTSDYHTLKESQDFQDV